MPKISVVIPTHNRPQLLIRAVESVLAQTYSDYEIVIIDDGSTDDTAKVVEQFLLTIPEKAGRVRYVWQKNIGLSGALNTGIANAVGEWLSFLADDDTWLPRKLELQMQAVETFRACGACFTDAHFVTHSDIELTLFECFGMRSIEKQGAIRDAGLFAVTNCCTWVQTFLVRADIVRRIGGFDATLPYWEDRDFIFRLALLTDLCFVNEPVVCIDRDPNRHSGSSTLWDALEFRLEHQKRVYEKWLTMSSDLPVNVRHAIVHRLQAVHSEWANLYLRQGQVAKARAALALAVSQSFTMSVTVKRILCRLSPRLTTAIVSARDRRRAHHISSTW